MDSTAFSLINFFSHYGLWILFLWLVIGIVIVPVPEEMVMLTVGILISRGVFSFWAYLVACAGSLCGTTVSYMLGRYLGRPAIVRCGRWIGLTDKRLDVADQWFDQYGKWPLIFGYFIPGGRHLVSIAAGTTDFGYKSFALFAYPSGIAWVVVLVTLGYVAGAYWLNVYHNVHLYIYYSILFVVGIFVLSTLIYWLISRKKSKK